MTTTEPVVLPITTQDKRTLKHADRIVFRLYQGKSSIEAIKDGKTSSDGFEQRHSVHCSTTMRDYSKEHYGVSRDEVSGYIGFSSSLSAQFDQDLRTLMDRIRPGDMLTLAWTRGNDNENNREIGWVRDELRLVITNDKGKNEVYLVDVRVGPNNSARMVQRKI